MLLLATILAGLGGRRAPASRNGKLKKGAVVDGDGLVVGYQCADKEIQIVKCVKSAADVVIAANHYSKKPTKNSFLSLSWFITAAKYTAHFSSATAYARRSRVSLRPKKCGSSTACG